MTQLLETRKHQVQLVLDVQDRFARDRMLNLSHARPLGDIRFFLLSTTVSDRNEVFDPPWEMLMLRNPSGYYLFFNQVRWPNGEKRRLDSLGNRCKIRIESTFYQPLERTIDLPARPYQIALEPSYTYPFVKLASLGSSLLRGTLRQPDGSSIRGARIRVKSNVAASERPDDPAASHRPNSYLTDSSGQWVLVFPDNDPDWDDSPGNRREITLQVKLSMAPDIYQFDQIVVERGVENTLPDIVIKRSQLTESTIEKVL